MNKLVKIAIAVIITVALVVGGYYFVYLPNYYDIKIGIAKPIETDRQYLEDFIIHYSHMPENKIPLTKEDIYNKNEK